MCGIVGGIGKFDVRTFVLNGLTTLEYRGYDSAGIALKTEADLHVFKTVGRVANLEAITPYIENVLLGIGHTRWATHGKPSEKNCHPHQSFQNHFIVVHNGVIENFRELKHRLLQNGYQFRSDTDTEVIANLIEEKYLITKDVLKAIELAIKELKGSYALAIIENSSQHRLYFAKNKSPLLIGKGKDGMYLASDALPMIEYCNQFIDLGNFEYGFISENHVSVFKEGLPIEIQYIERTAELLNKDLGDYPHYMLKEIEEAPDCIQRLIDNYYDNQHFLFHPDMMKLIEASDNVIFIACGTSYYASLVGKHYMESLGKRSEAYIASEWAYYPKMGGQKPVFFLVSQSGETADLIHCCQIIKEKNLPVITLTNVKGSTLERDSTYSLLLYAGVEIAVASTKAYVAQVALLALLKAALENRTDILSDFNNLCDIYLQIKGMKQEFKAIAEELKDHSHIFFLGRGIDYELSLEASLKLKEITYIHSEAFYGGELKHGPIALIEKGTPVFGFISDKKTNMPLRANYEEVRARGAKVISIASQSLAKEEDRIVVPDTPLHLSVLVKVMIAQYIAYYTALALDRDIDKPRNLAKSVTVE